MKNEQLIALIDILVDERVNEIPNIQGKRGLRGLRGEKGESGSQGEVGKDAVFNFEEYQEIIFNKIKELIPTYDDFSEEEKLRLRGPRGQRGKSGIDGADFNWDDHKELIFQRIAEHKLKFSDLTNNEKESLRGLQGPRGLKGLSGKDGRDGQDGKDGVDGEDGVKGERGLRGYKGLQGRIGPQGDNGEDGESFNWEDHSEEITKIIIDNKLKFNDLTWDEKQEIRGPRGMRGQKGLVGRDGLSAYEIWLKNNDGEELDFLKSLIGKTGTPGISGLNGKDGLDGKDGLNGSDGFDAPRITKVELDKNDKDKYRFVFYFDDGSILRTNFVKIDASGVMQNITSVTSSSTYIPVSDEGDLVTERAKSFNFVGDLVEATDDGEGNVEVNISSPDTSSIVLKNVDCDSTVYVGAAVRMTGAEIAVNAIADDVNNSNVLGFVEVKTSTVKCDIRVTGITPDNYSGLDVTKTYYLSDTVAGGLQTNIPSASGHVKLKLGQPFSSDKMVFMKGEVVIRS